MKFLFSPQPEDIVDGDEESWFNHEGKQYAYNVEFDDRLRSLRLFYINDTCNRSIPFELEDLDRLIDALYKVKQYVDPIIRAEKLVLTLENPNAVCAA